jgi:hypothetical protein
LDISLGRINGELRMNWLLEEIRRKVVVGSEKWLGDKNELFGKVKNVVRKYTFIHFFL